jgi:hypothetical protein
LNYISEVLQVWLEAELARLTPIADDGRQLEAQAFAERCGRLKKYIMTFNHCGDDLSL